MHVPSLQLTLVLRPTWTIRRLSITQLRVGALRVLLQNEADISAQDYKKRTPLQLAANLGTATLTDEGS